MAEDVYPNFAALAEKEREQRDYRIRLENRETPVVLIAPHGGAIEPGTSEIAEAIARDNLSMYAFEGLRQRSSELHITSHRFDEPRCLKLVTGAEAAVARLRAFSDAVRDAIFSHTNKKRAGPGSSPG